jgi:hypothetical protein
MPGIILLANGTPATRHTVSPCYLVGHTVAVLWLDAAAHGVKS